jgi:hypothetical protein
MSYEAKYTMNCLVFEKWLKTYFGEKRQAKNQFWRVYQKVSILRYMLFDNIIINMAIRGQET